MKCVLLRQVFGFTKSGRYHSVDRMLLDGPGGHLGDHTGADDRLGSAMRGPRQPNGQLPPMRCREGLLQPDERQRRAEQARRAYFARLSLAAVKARQAKRAARAQPPEDGTAA